MAHSLVRIKEKLVNTPHLIDRSSFNSIMSYVNSRIEGNVDVTPSPEAASNYDRPNYIKDTKTGVMHVSGPLTNKTTGWEALCGGTSYQMLKDQMEYFVAQGAKTVVMMADSGGGEAHGMMDSANYMRKLADENDIKIIAYVDGMAASACYGLVCMADEIVMSSDSMVGSIGVLIQLMNNSKQLEKAGIERTFITAGKDKVPFAADGTFTESFIERLQAQVDTLYEGFTSHVAQHRDMDIQAVKDTEANVFLSEDALKLGLADSVMTLEEFYDYAGEAASNNKGGDMKGALKFMNKGEQVDMSQVEALQAQLTSETEARTVAEAAVLEFTQKLTAQTELVASLTSQLEEFKQAQADALQAAADAALAQRKAALAEVVPEAELETYLTNMSALDDAAFSFMVSTLQAGKDARAEEFKAVGEDGVEDVDTPVSTTEAIRLAGIERAKALRG